MDALNEQSLPATTKAPPRRRMRRKREPDTGNPENLKPPNAHFSRDEGFLSDAETTPDASASPAVAMDMEAVNDLESGGLLLTVDNAAVPASPTKKALKKMAKIARQVDKDAGDIIHTISPDELILVPEPVTWDQDPELLCSYNWQETSETNTIFVPGGPPKWAPKPLPHILQQDSGFTFMDYNYVRQPRDPYAPLFHALKIMNPTYCFNDIDVLADRNNLRVLLEFVSGVANGPFRLDVFTTLNTLILARNGERFLVHHNPNSAKTGAVPSYGTTFEKTFTRPADGMHDATSHYRAIRYPMGPLNVVCRFEADAYYDPAPDSLTATEAAAVTGSSSTPSDNIASPTSTATPNQRPTFTYNTPIRPLQKGHLIPSNQIAELKTSTHKPGAPFRTPPCKDQLWFGRTTHLITARYDAATGLIGPNRIRIDDMTSQMQGWEAKQQDNLRKLVALLVRVREVVRQEEGPIRAMVLVREERGGPVVLRRKVVRWPIVKREFFERFWRLERPGGARGRGRGGGFVGRAGGFTGPAGLSHAPLRGGGGFAVPTEGERHAPDAQRGGGRGRGQRGRGQGRGRGRGNGPSR